MKKEMGEENDLTLKFKEAINDARKQARRRQRED